MLRNFSSFWFCLIVQPYTTNSAKVVFLNQRPMSRPFRGSGNFCIACDRSLQDPYFFCSLSCKVNFNFPVKIHNFDSIIPSGSCLFSPKSSPYLLQVHQQLMTKNSSGNREFLPILPDKARIESLSVSENEEDGQMTPDSVLDSHVSLSGSRSTASASGCVGGNVSVVSCKTLACTANLEFVKKKRSSLNSVPRVSCQPRYSPAAEIAVALNRRKSVPHRSPLN